MNAVYRKRNSAEILWVDSPFAVIPDGRERRAAYVTKTLLVVIVAGDDINLPDTIRVKFEADESPAPTRAAWLLTTNLFELIWSRCCTAEAAWERGEMTNADYETMRARFAVIREVYESLPRIEAFEQA